MGRSFTKSWANDRLQEDDFCEQHGLLEKLLYHTLFRPDETDNAGLGRLTVRRWLKLLSPATEAEVWAALANLERTRDVFVDPDTEEILAREFMYRDQVGLRPYILINAARSAAQVRSPKLAAVLLEELARVDVHRPSNPEIAARLDAALLAAEEHLRARAARLEIPGPGPGADRAPTGSETLRETLSERVSPSDAERPESAGEGAVSEPFPKPCVVVEVGVAPSRSVLHPIQETNYLEQPVTCAVDRDPPKPTSVATASEPDRPHAPPGEHVPGPECRTTPCGPCADAARTTITARTEHTADRGACALCDHHGHRIEPPELAHLSLPVIRCDHTPMSLDDWRRRAPTPVQVRPGDWSTRKTPTSRKRTRTHAPHDRFPGHRDHGQALAS